MVYVEIIQIVTLPNLDNASQQCRSSAMRPMLIKGQIPHSI